MAFTMRTVGWFGIKNPFLKKGYTVFVGCVMRLSYS